MRREVELPTLGTLSGLGGESDGASVFAGFSSFAQPSSVYRIDPATGARELFAATQLPANANPSDVAVNQVWYPSKDGTPISMFLVHRSDLVLDGKNPTFLTGYGGFADIRAPAFDSALLLWLAAGGVYALANLRGGGSMARPGIRPACWTKSRMCSTISSRRPSG